MRTATTKHEIGKSPVVMIDGMGTMSMINFADILYSNGKIDLKTRNSAKRCRFSNEFATRLLNENLELFPAWF
jgi:hypothetical protein